MAAPISVGQRFSRLIQHLGVSKNAFAQSLNKTATVVQHLVDERNKPGYDLLCKVFEVYPNVSKDWLLLGQGPMLTSPAAAPSAGAALPPVGELFAVNPPPAAAGSPRASTKRSSSSAAAAEPTPKPEAAQPATADNGLTAGLAALLALPAAPAASPAAEAYLTAALHAQHLQHQLALAEQRNQHLLAQQQLMQQMLELAQRR